MGATEHRPNVRGVALEAALLVVASYAFRAPVLLNAHATNSDAAVVGLQAMHLLRGEWSAFLWGSGYQTSADAFVAAGFFVVLGPTALALTLSALTLHVVTTLLVHRTLLAHLPRAKALLLTLPLVFSSPTVHTYALYPPRQLSLTLAVAALCAIDVASRGGRRRWLAAGGLLATLAAAADPYPLLLVPLTALFGLLVVHTRASRARDLAALASGLATGAAPFVALRLSPRAAHGPLGLTLDKLQDNLWQLARNALPWTLGTKVFGSYDTLHYDWWWDLPDAIGATGFAGTVALVALLMVSVAACLTTKARARLGVVALLGLPLTLAAFLASVMIFDHFAMRYLVAIPLLVPFALVPAARVLRTSVLATLVLAHVAATGIAGWLGFAPFVDGANVVRQALDPASDDALHEALRGRGVRVALADYWASYRLTLLWKEDVLVVPLVREQDRYAPYRAELEREPLVAYVHDRLRSREGRAETERLARAAGVVAERREVGGYTVFFVLR